MADGNLPVIVVEGEQEELLALLTANPRPWNRPLRKRLASSLGLITGHPYQDHANPRNPGCAVCGRTKDTHYNLGREVKHDRGGTDDRGHGPDRTGGGTSHGR